MEPKMEEMAVPRQGGWMRLAQFLEMSCGPFEELGRVHCDLSCVFCRVF